MRNTVIPNTTLRVSTICLGTGDVGSTIDQETSINLLDMYYEQGGNFLDTAKVYADWLPGERSISEKTIGQWLQIRKNRHQIVLATKGAHPDLATMQIPRLSRQEIESDLDASLINLKTDVIDLYWLHRDNVNQPVGEILETMNAQVKAGKILYFGFSNWRKERLKEAQAYTSQYNLVCMVANQMLWSLAVVDPDAIPDKTIAIMDHEMRQYHQETGLAAIPYSSQANGLFHKIEQKTLHRMDPGIRGMYHEQKNRERYKRIKKLSADTSLSITQIVLGFLLSQPFTTVPIVGCKTLKQLKDSLSASEVELDPEQVRYLEYG